VLEDLHGKDEKKWPAERSDFCSSRRCEGVQVRLQTNEERRELLHSKVEDYKKERLRKHMAKDRWKVRPRRTHAPAPIHLRGSRRRPLSESPGPPAQRWKSEQKYKRVGAAETDYRRCVRPPGLC